MIISVQMLEHRAQEASICLNAQPTIQMLFEAVGLRDYPAETQQMRAVADECVSIVELALTPPAR